MSIDTRRHDAVDLSSLAFWAGDAEDRERSYAQLRRVRPVSWQRPVEGNLIENPDDPGYWAVLSHALVSEVSRHPETFCSSKGANFEEFPEALVAAISSIIAMDAPRHTRLRRLISSAFTPRHVATIEEQIRAQVRVIVDDLIDLGEGDFVEHVSNRLPMWTISQMIGVPEADRPRVATAAHAMAGWNDPEIQAGRDPMTLMIECFTVLTQVAGDLVRARRQSPGDDVMSALVHAEIDGQRLTEEEIMAFFALLAIAGNDTTRNTTSYGLKSLYERPEQLELVRDDIDGRVGGAVEEMIRWTSPVMTMRRTATRDVVLGGQPVREGEKVVMFYASANRDEAAFSNPHEFDVLRDPNPHVGFGGGGPHHCLGAAIARLQLRLITGELLRRVPGLQFGEPVYSVSNFTHSVGSLPCRVR